MLKSSLQFQSRRERRKLPHFIRVRPLCTPFLAPQLLSYPAPPPTFPSPFLPGPIHTCSQQWRRLKFSSISWWLCRICSVFQQKIAVSASKREDKISKQRWMVLKMLARYRVTEQFRSKRGQLFPGSNIGCSLWDNQLTWRWNRMDWFLQTHVWTIWLKYLHGKLNTRWLSNQRLSYSLPQLDQGTPSLPADVAEGESRHNKNPRSLISREIGPSIKSFWIWRRHFCLK